MKLDPAWLHWHETQSLLKAFAGQPDAIRFVGGAVRDALLGRPVSDVDVATSLAPEKTIALLERAKIKAIPTGLAHGTVTAVVSKRRFEITTLRKDVATDGRHAKVEFTDDWQEDAQRRDFTMNALYLSASGELFDYTGGAEDARAGRVRFIGDAALRIREDYLRVLRFFRFYAWYGASAPEASALAACATGAEKLKTLSGERIQHEMFKLLGAPQPHAALQAMQQAGVLQLLLGFAPSLKPVQILQTLEQATGCSPDAFVRLALLLRSAEILGVIAQAWKLSGEQNGILALLLAHADALPPGSPLAAQKRLLRKLGKDDFRRLVLLSWSGQAEDSAAHKAYMAMLKLSIEWTPPVFPLRGADLQLLGIPKGKRIGELLQALEQRWEESDYQLTKEGLLRNIQI